MKFSIYMSQESFLKKNKNKKIGLKYNKSLHRLESKNIIIDLTSGHASINGITVGRRLKNKYILTSHVYIYNKELEKIKNTLELLGKKVDCYVRASYGLDRIPDMITEVTYEIEMAKTKKVISLLKNENKDLSKILNLVDKQDKEDLKNFDVIGKMMQKLTQEKELKLENKIISLVKSNLKKEKNNLKVEIGGAEQDFIYRVKLSEDQAIVAIKENDSVKIKFENEKLSSGFSSFASLKNPEMVFNDIKDSRELTNVSNETCIEGIKLILELLEGKASPSLNAGFNKAKKSFILGNSHGKLIKSKI